jgi:hypothetical protein
MCQQRNEGRFGHIVLVVALSDDDTLDGMVAEITEVLREAGISASVTPTMEEDNRP